VPCGAQDLPTLPGAHLTAPRTAFRLKRDVPIRRIAASSVRQCWRAIDTPSGLARGQ
jgi:hypothetical protein